MRIEVLGAVNLIEPEYRVGDLTSGLLGALQISSGADELS